MQTTYRPHKHVRLYFPYLRGVLLRTLAIWLVLRLVLEGGVRRLEPGTELHPLAAAGLILFVIWIDRIHARAMRETVFRANAGIPNGMIAAAAALPGLLLEPLFRALP